MLRFSLIGQRKKIRSLLGPRFPADRREHRGREDRRTGRHQAQARQARHSTGQIGRPETELGKKALAGL